MKRYIKFFVIALVSIIIPFKVFAEKTNIKDTSIVDIKIPENWKLVTRENIDEMTTWLGYDAATAKTYKYNWIKNYYCADIVSDAKDKFIHIIKNISDFKYDDLSIYPDEEIMNSFKDIEKSYKGHKPKIYLYTTTKGINYYKVEYTDEENSLYLIDYLTSIHGNLYKFKYQSSSTITDEEKSIIENIINSTEYNNYNTFVKNNKIVIEEKKDTSASSIIIVFVILIIIVVGFVIFLKLMKKKTKKEPTVVTPIYNPVQKDAPKNPSIQDFLVEGKKDNK